MSRSVTLIFGAKNYLAHGLSITSLSSIHRFYTCASVCKKLASSLTGETQLPALLTDSTPSCLVTSSRISSSWPRDVESWAISAQLPMSTPTSSAKYDFGSFFFFFSILHCQRWFVCHFFTKSSSFSPFK